MGRGPKIIGTYISAPNGIGVSVPQGSDIEIQNSRIEAGQRGFEERDAPIPLIWAPPDEMLRILRDFAAAQPATEDAAVEQLQKSGAGKWLKAGHTLLEVAKWSITHPHEIAELIKQAEKFV